LLSRYSQSLPFQKVKHEFGPPDAQPTPNGGIIILVTGQLIVCTLISEFWFWLGVSGCVTPPTNNAGTQVDDESRPLPYSQAFQLCQDAQGQWFVFNDVFKLVLG
jgi:hypothetical protein